MFLQSAPEPMRSTRPAVDADPLVIGFVNNMPDAALRTSERQFRELLSATTLAGRITLKPFFLPEIPRSDLAQSYLRQHYLPLSDLWSCRIDGLIVTGNQPRAADLTDEPYWNAMARLVDWAQDHTTSTVWSCLAAHAVVLHMDGIERIPLGGKLSGVYECRKLVNDPILAGVPARWRVPHSRYNGLDENSLLGAGYRLLSTSREAGIDLFTRQLGSLFVFLHGHPEYDPTALCREYRRDVTQFLSGERDRFPGMPKDYFDAATELALEAFRRRAIGCRDLEILSEFPARPVDACPWQETARTIFANWLDCLLTQRAAHGLGVVADFALAASSGQQNDFQPAGHGDDTPNRR
jgi:homoserine O-succinyltransferase